MTKDEATLLLDFLDMHDRFKKPGTWTQYQYNQTRKKLVKIAWKAKYGENIDKIGK